MVSDSIDRSINALYIATFFEPLQLAGVITHELCLLLKQVQEHMHHGIVVRGLQIDKAKICSVTCIIILL